MGVGEAKGWLSYSGRQAGLHRERSEIFKCYSIIVASLES
jgi:hypothetical protein